MPKKTIPPHDVVKIHNDDWLIVLMPPKAFKSHFPKNAVAVTQRDWDETKIMAFRPDFITESIVIHEVTHAYFTYTCNSSASLNAHQVEETMCDLFATEGRDILQTSRQIYRALRRLSRKTQDT